METRKKLDMHSGIFKQKPCMVLFNFKVHAVVAEGRKDPICRAIHVLDSLRLEQQHSSTTRSGVDTTSERPRTAIAFLELRNTCCMMFHGNCPLISTHQKLQKSKPLTLPNLPNGGIC